MWKLAEKDLSETKLLNLSLYSLYHTDACNEFAGPISASLRLRATQLLLKKCRNGGEPLASLCSI